AMGVSFVHGSNDGQKGIGLIMLVLIGIVPANFVLDQGSSNYEITRTRSAALQLEQLYQTHQVQLSQALDKGQRPVTDLPTQFSCDANRTKAVVADLVAVLEGVTSYTAMPAEDRIKVRRDLLCLDDAAKRIAKLPGVSPSDMTDLAKLRKDLTATTEYAPFWVI